MKLMSELDVYDKKVMDYSLYSVKFSTESLRSTLISSYEIFKGLVTSHLKLKTLTISTAIGSATSLLFHTLTKLLDHIPDEHCSIKTEAITQSKKLVKKICNMTTVWLVEMYGKTFGSPHGRAILCCAGEELAVCR